MFDEKSNPVSDFWPTLYIINIYATLFQYFEKSNLERSLSSFLQELRDFDMPVKQTTSSSDNPLPPFGSVSDSTLSHLCEMFDNAYEDAFFRVWDDPGQVPHLVHQHGTDEEGTSSSYVRINFRLHVYFCCRKMRDGYAPQAECLQVSTKAGYRVYKNSDTTLNFQNLRSFFDREGTASLVSNEQEFIHYFALPFVSDPENHPTFKGLFEVQRNKAAN